MMKKYLVLFFIFFTFLLYSQEDKAILKLSSSKVDDKSPLLPTKTEEEYVKENAKELRKKELTRSIDIAFLFPIYYVLDAYDRNSPIFNGFSITPEAFFEFRFLESRKIGFYTAIGYAYDFTAHKKSRNQLHSLKWRIGVNLWINPEFYFGFGFLLKQVLSESNSSKDRTYKGSNFGADFHIAYQYYFNRSIYMPFEFQFSSTAAGNGAVNFNLGIAIGIGGRIVIRESEKRKKRKLEKARNNLKIKD